MKKLFVLIILILTFFIFFPKKQDNTAVTIKFATWGSQTETEILKPLLKKFEKDNPDIKVELMHIPQNYFQKIHLLFASNSAPDVIFINNFYLPFFANAGVLKPIEGDFGGFEEKSLQALTFNNKLYAVPRDISVVVMFRNKTLFKKCGISLNSKNWTTEEFLKTSLKLKECKVFGVSFETSPPLFYLPYLMSEGGGILSDDAKNYIFDSSKSQKALHFYSDLRNKYHVAPTADESANMTMAQMFLNQKVALHLSGHWLVPKYTKEADFEWDTIPFPRGSEGSVVSLDASGWAISSDSKYPDEAKKLIDFLSSKESIKAFSQSGLIVPARKDILTGEFKNSPVNNAFIDAVNSAKPTPVSVNYNQLTDKITQETDYLFTSLKP